MWQCRSGINALLQCNQIRQTPASDSERVPKSAGARGGAGLFSQREDPPQNNTQRVPIFDWLPLKNT
jgi:hypothetical protein